MYFTIELLQLLKMLLFNIFDLFYIGDLEFVDLLVELFSLLFSLLFFTHELLDFLLIFLDSSIVIQLLLLVVPDLAVKVIVISLVFLLTIV